MIHQLHLPSSPAENPSSSHVTPRKHPNIQSTNQIQVWMDRSVRLSRLLGTITPDKKLWREFHAKFQKFKAVWQYHAMQALVELPNKSQALKTVEQRHALQVLVETGPQTAEFEDCWATVFTSWCPF